MSYQLEIRHIQYFLAVAEELHFKKAADKLFISQPGLSRQIKQMEDQLGVTLFYRDNRNVELSNVGEYLKQELSVMMKHIDLTIEHAQLMEKGIEGSLKMGYIGSAMHEIIPNMLIEIKNNNLNTRFDLKEMDNTTQINALLHQEIDFGFVRMERIPNSLSTKEALEDTFSLVLPEEHPITIENFKNIKQLQAESFILFESNYSQSYYEKVMQIFDDSGFSPVVSHNSVEASTIYRLVENKLGVAIVPTTMKSGYDMKVKFIELTKIKQRTTLRAVWNPNNRNPIIKKVIEMI